MNKLFVINKQKVPIMLQIKHILKGTKTWYFDNVTKETVKSVTGNYRSANDRDQNVKNQTTLDVKHFKIKGKRTGKVT